MQSYGIIPESGKPRLRIDLQTWGNLWGYNVLMNLRSIERDDDTFARKYSIHLHGHNSNLYTDLL
jgi:hypothetical protein